MSASTVFYTRDYDKPYRSRGYFHQGQPRAIVEAEGLAIEAHGSDDLAAMVRLIDVLRSAVAQARQAEQDETLAAEPVAVSA